MFEGYLSYNIVLGLFLFYFIIFNCVFILFIFLFSPFLPLHIYYGFQFNVFRRFLSVQMNESPFLVPSLELFLSVFSNSNVFVFILPYYIISYYYPLEACLFSDEPQKGSGSGKEGSGEELESIEGEVTIIKIYYMRKIYIFNKKKRRDRKGKDLCLCNTKYSLVIFKTTDRG